MSINTNPKNADDYLQSLNKSIDYYYDATALKSELEVIRLAYVRRTPFPGKTFANANETHQYYNEGSNICSEMVEYIARTVAFGGKTELFSFKDPYSTRHSSIPAIGIRVLKGQSQHEGGTAVIYPEFPIKFVFLPNSQNHAGQLPVLLGSAGAYLHENRIFLTFDDICVPQSKRQHLDTNNIYYEIVSANDFWQTTMLLSNITPEQSDRFKILQLHDIAINAINVSGHTPKDVEIYITKSNYYYSKNGIPSIAVKFDDKRSAVFAITGNNVSVLLFDSGRRLSTDRIDHHTGLEGLANHSFPLSIPFTPETADILKQLYTRLLNPRVQTELNWSISTKLPGQKEGPTNPFEGFSFDNAEYPQSIALQQAEIRETITALTEHIPEGFTWKNTPGSYGLHWNTTTELVPGGEADKSPPQNSPKLAFRAGKSNECDTHTMSHLEQGAFILGLVDGTEIHYATNGQTIMGVYQDGKKILATAQPPPSIPKHPYGTLVQEFGKARKAALNTESELETEA